MLAKVIVSAMTWEDAIKRGERALKDMGLFGIKTTIPYYLEVLKHPEFRDAVFNTGFVEKHPELVNYIDNFRPGRVTLSLTYMTTQLNLKPNPPKFYP